MMNRMKLPRLAGIDVVAIVGLTLLATGVGLMFVPAAALVVVGLAFVLYAIAVSAAAQADGSRQ